MYQVPGIFDRPFPFFLVVCGVRTGGALLRVRVLVSAEGNVQAFFFQGSFIYPPFFFVFPDFVWDAVALFARVV